jgi:mannosyltransferase OCH1-like enzyme
MALSAQSDALPIIQYWHSPKIPPDVAELIATFRDLNPSLRHMMFNEATAEAFIAEHFTSREVDAFRSCAVPAMQSDYFRNCAVLALGGVYVDADCFCQRSLQSLIDSASGGILFENSRGHTLNGFFAFQAPGHPLLQLALDATTENIERRISDEVHIVTGPWVLSGLSVIHAIGLSEARRHFAGRRFERVMYSIADAAGDHERLSTAFEGIRVESFETVALDWIGKPTVKPRYKDGEDHWVNWHAGGRAIFR